MITGIFTIRNGIKTGYAFVEAILSILPITDKFLISDGASKDGTFEALKKLKETFPEKIELFQMQDKTSKRWECIDKHINCLIDKVEKDWIFEIQGDEFYHEDTLFFMKDTMNLYKHYNAIRQPRWVTPWDINRPYTLYVTVRCVRKIDGLVSLQGGDYFTIENYSTPIKNVAFLNIPFYHFNSIFLKNAYFKAKRHSSFLATCDGSRHDITKNLKNVYDEMPDKNITTELSKNVPAIIKDMYKYNKYFVREELFDKEWLTKTTGLNYYFD